MWRCRASRACHAVASPKVGPSGRASIHVAPLVQDRIRMHETSRWVSAAGPAALQPRLTRQPISLESRVRSLPSFQKEPHQRLFE
jgi:hypothetical protein